MKPKKSLYVVFEGVDGAGTSIRSKITRYFLEKLKIKYLYVREHSRESRAGILIEMLLHSNRFNIKEISIKEQTTGKTKKFDKNNEKLLNLFTEDRYYVIDKIKSDKRKRKIIISDRNFLSSMAYQLKGDINKCKEYLAKNPEFLIPDVLVYVYSPLKVSYTRAKRTRANKATDFDKDIKLQKQVKEAYEKILKAHALGEIKIARKIVRMHGNVEDIEKQMKHFFKKEIVKKIM